MKIVLVSATTAEIDPLLEHLQVSWDKTSDNTYVKDNCTVDILITGIGMHRMAYALGSVVGDTSVDLFINAGVAGAFPGKAAIGDVVHVTREVLADLGIEDKDGNMLTLESAGLEEDISSYQGLTNAEAAPYSFLRSVDAITVNKTHGNERSIAQIINKWNPGIETMEGGAFFYCCLKAGVSFIEIRAISNLIEPRNKKRWNLPLAINNLCRQLQEILQFFVE